MSSRSARRRLGERRRPRSLIDIRGFLPWKGVKKPWASQRVIRMVGSLKRVEFALDVVDRKADPTKKYVDFDRDGKPVLRVGRPATLSAQVLHLVCGHDLIRPRPTYQWTREFARCPECPMQFKVRLK